MNGQQIFEENKITKMYLFFKLNSTDKIQKKLLLSIYRLVDLL